MTKQTNFEVLKTKVLTDILKNGSLQPVTRYAPIEILNYFYEYDSTLVCNVTDEKLKYVIDKLETYKESLEDVNKRLFFHRSNRQSVIQFDQSGILPNCTVAIQFQVRENVLHLTVFQRSQDIAKMEMDCEIFNRMALEVVKEQKDIESFDVKVLVGNMHKFTQNDI